MSLDHQQREVTRRELTVNLERTGQTPAELAQTLGLTEGEVRAALELDGARPEHVWLLRDQLDRYVEAGGARPHPYSVLTEQARIAARRWFDLTDPVDVSAGAGR